MDSLFIACKNNEWCHFVVRIDSPVLASFDCVCFVLLFLFVFLFFVGAATC